MNINKELLEALEKLLARIEEVEDIEHYQFGCEDPECALCCARQVVDRTRKVLSEPVIRTPELTEFLQDIMTTAVEGGINYWASLAVVRRDVEKNVMAFLCRDVEDSTDPWHQINEDEIEKALDKICECSSPIAIGEQYRDMIRKAYRTLDAGLIDADLADIIVQIAAYDELVFG